MFHPDPPAPCFLYGWPALQAIEVILEAFAVATPEAVPACSGGDLCGVLWWGVREQTGETWGDGSPFPVGQGAHHRGDGASSLLHVAESATRFTPVEIWESRRPWVTRTLELAPDSGGAGQHRGGLGIDLVFEHTEDCYVTTTIERTKSPPWGLAGGLPGRPNSAVVTHPDGTQERLAKRTGFFLAKGSTVALRNGGGGGYGPPRERDVTAVHRDLKEGYVTESHAREHYPHALDGTPEISPHS
jgi:N-methylhydantoinase B